MSVDWPLVVIAVGTLVALGVLYLALTGDEG